MVNKADHCKLRRAQHNLTLTQATILHLTTPNNNQTSDSSLSNI